MLFFAWLGLGAGAAQLTILLDTDLNNATGCTVPTPAGNFAGAEVVLTTDVVTTTSPPTVGAVVQQTCTSPPAGLSAPVPVSPGGWSVGAGLGIGGLDVIETYFPVGTPVGVYRVGFVYTDPVTGTDALITSTGLVGGGPVIFAFGALGGIGIPALTDAGIFLLALLVFFVAARTMRRHKLPTTLVVALFAVIMTSAAIAAIVLDGQIADWTGVSPIANDQLGDSPPGSDIGAVFAKHEAAENRIYFRADVRTASPPAAVNDTYAGTAGVTLNIAASGVLSNDARGIPAANVASFGGGGAGGTVTTNAAGASAAFGVGGSLQVNANGSFAFTPATGFNGPFVFDYRITNAYGSSDAQVTITVNQAPAITSANATTFAVGSANSFNVTTTGFPAPTITFGACAPALPAGVAFVDNGNGTGTLSGNPPSGSAGTYACTVSATSTAGGPVTQGFTLTINEGPVATNDGYSVAHDTVLNVPAGTGLLANDTGSPAPAVSSVTGSGPACTVFPCAIATTSGNATVQANGSFSYTPNAAFAGSDGFSYVATNVAGSSGATVTLTVTNVAPLVDLNGPAAGIDFGPAAYAEGGAPVAIVDGAQLTVADADSLNLASATIVVTNLLDGPAETLAVTCPVVAPGCSGAILAADVVYTPATGTLAITRSAPLADYQVLLRTLTYANSSLAPTTTDRDITVTVNDGIGNNAPLAHATVSLSAVDNPPTITAPATAVTPVNTPFNFAATASVADPDSGASPVVVTLTTTNGTATLSGTAGLVVTGNGTALVVSTGPIAAQNAALNGLVFTPTAAYSGAASLRIDIDDQGNTGTGGPLTATRTVAITVDTPPTVTSTVPTNGATAIGLNATVTVNFSEAVTVTGTAFKLECPVGSPVAFSVAPASPAASFVLTPGAPLPAGMVCTVTVVATQVTDSAAQQMAADYTASFTVDTLPTVTSTVPANGATAVAPSTTVTVNFSEPVNAALASFTLECPVATPRVFTLSASPSSTFVLTPTAALPTGTTCTVTVLAAQVTDVDASQNMAANFAFSFTTATPPTITSAATTTFTVGSAGTFTVTTTGNPTPAITRTGTLPAALSFLDNGDGTATLSGTPAAGTEAASPYAQVLTATNLAGFATQNFSLRICPVISATPAAITQPTRTNAYSFALGGSGGTGPYTFAVTGGALPAGLGMSAAGAITGTVTGAGAYSFTVTVTDTVGGCTGATPYSGTINEPPAAGTDSYEAVGNTLLEVASPGVAATPKILVTTSNVLSNDNDGNGGANGTGVTATAGTFASTNGGTVTLAANGTFTYLPAVGFTGADSFTYTVSDGVGTATGTVNVTVVAHRVWYVNNAGAAGDGRSSSPFNTLAAAATAANSANDTIYVFFGDGTTFNQNAGVTLDNSQRLVGQGVALDVPVTVNGVATPTLQAAGSTPVIGNTAGNGVSLAANNTLKGFNVGASSGTAISGANVGTLAISVVSINTTGAGLDLTGVGQPTVSVVLGSLSSTGGTKNVNLVGLAGAVNLGGGVLSGASSHAFDVSGAGTANITYTGTISNSSTNARVVSVASKTGGTVSLSGAITSSGTNPAGVVLTNNTGTTIAFSGSLSLGTGTNAAFTATGGGTVSASAAGSTLVTTTATALNVANTTIGAADLIFRSITAGTGASGPANGIVLTSTGTLGGLVVTGNGGTCTVATPTCTGGQIQRTTGDAVLLTSTNNASLSFMNIHNNLGSGIRGTTLNGFMLDSSLITDNADSVAVDESGIELIGLTGTAIGGANPTSITNTTIRNNFEFELQITNTSGTLTDLQMSGNTISSDGATAQHGNLVNFLALGSATMKLSLTSGSFTGAAPATATGVQCDHSGTSGTVTCNVSGATFTNNNVAVSVSQANGGNLKFNVVNNTATGNRAHGLNLFVAAVGTGTVDGSFLNNTVGTFGTVGSGSSIGYGIRVQNEGVSTANPANVLISGNIVQETASFGGINVNQGIAGQASSKTTNVTITNNVIREVDSGRAIVVQQNNGTSGTSAGVTCADVSGNEMNNIAGQAGDGTKLRFRKLDGNGGVFNVRQTSIADLAAANTPPVGVAITTTTAGQISVGGTPTFAQPACTQPAP